MHAQLMVEYQNVFFGDKPPVWREHSDLSLQHVNSVALFSEAPYLGTARIHLCHATDSASPKRSELFEDTSLSAPARGARSASCAVFTCKIGREHGMKGPAADLWAAAIASGGV